MKSWFSLELRTIYAIYCFKWLNRNFVDRKKSKDFRDAGISFTITKPKNYLIKKFHLKRKYYLRVMTVNTLVLSKFGLCSGTPNAFKLWNFKAQANSGQKRTEIPPQTHL